MVIGAGSLSFELMKSLTDRLPVMLCPRWLTTPTQPIAVDDVLAYLVAAKDLPPGESRIFEIGGTDVSTYGDVIREYARQRRLRRWLISVPVLTPYLSGLWLALVTPASFEVGTALDRRLEEPHGGSGLGGARGLPDPPDGYSRGDREGREGQMTRRELIIYGPKSRPTATLSRNGRGVAGIPVWPRRACRLRQIRRHILLPVAGASARGPSRSPSGS